MNNNTLNNNEIVAFGIDGDFITENLDSTTHSSSTGNSDENLDGDGISFVCYDESSRRDANIFSEVAIEKIKNKIDKEIRINTEIQKQNQILKSESKRTLLLNIALYESKKQIIVENDNENKSSDDDMSTAESEEEKEFSSRSHQLALPNFGSNEEDDDDDDSVPSNPISRQRVILSPSSCQQKELSIHVKENNCQKNNQMNNIAADSAIRTEDIPAKQRQLREEKFGSDKKIVIAHTA